MNATNAHTPGPWKAVESRSHALGDTVWYIEAEAIDGQKIAGMGPLPIEDREGCETMAADARLMASAPALLAALEGLALITHAIEDLPTWACNKCGSEWSAMMNEADVPETCACGGTVVDVRLVLADARAALRLARGA